ncbi:DHS-like NAD/FAD-binding domain-containing protein [Mycena leptocephala]|nr:DHS-like NAD/FAD-binding domain-containing protein [Mycena leptocephala]
MYRALMDFNLNCQLNGPCLSLYGSEPGPPEARGFVTERDAHEIICIRTRQYEELAMSSETPSSPNQDPELGNFSVNRSLASAQIRAFLAASEDVDIEPETVEELVQALILETASSSADNESSGIRLSESSPEPDGFDVEVSALDMSALYFFPDQDVEKAWSQQQIRGMSSWMNEYVLKRNIPIPQLLVAFGINLLRDKLPNHNTVEDAVRLIRDSRRILILTGAGVSVSCGIPDFRSRDGLYASLKQRSEYDLDDPQQMFDINYFRENPAVCEPDFCLWQYLTARFDPQLVRKVPGYSTLDPIRCLYFLSQIYPSNFVPSPCHRFIKLVESKNQNYTQNIDNLDVQCGVTRVLQCHGSFATASCLLCRRQVPGSEIEADIMTQKVPLCSVCNTPKPGGAPKSKKRSAKKAKGGWDSDDEDESDGPTYPPGIMKANRNEVDLLLVIGTSLKVSPVADILSSSPFCAPARMGMPSATNDASSHPPGFLAEKIKKRSAADLHVLEEPRRVGESHIWVFEGAEGGEWLQNIEQRISALIRSRVQKSRGWSSRNTGWVL